MDLFASKSLLFLLSFIGCCASQHILPEGPLDGVLGKNVTFTTLLDKPNYQLVIWNFKNEHDSVNIATRSSTGLNVNDHYKGRVNIDSVNGNLFLSSLQPEDSGDYNIVVVKTGPVTETADITLRVLEPVSEVTITPSLPEVIEHNSTLTLTCTAKGSFLMFTWLNDTKPIEADESNNRITLKQITFLLCIESQEETSSMLTITNVLRSDVVGPIYCTAANKLETEKSAALKLTVYYGPDEVTIAPSNPPEYIRAGSDFNLSCSSSSNPPATFVWYRSQTMMESTGPVLGLDTIEKLGLGKEMAEYSCRAKNDKTLRTVASPAVSFATMEPISGVKITAPTVALIAGNSSANLSCIATAGIVESRSWLKDGKPLSPNSRLVFSADMSSLMINRLQKEDNGEYVCQLNNPVTTEKASYKMVVNYGPEAAVVTVVPDNELESGGKAIEVNDRVEFTCSAASIPPATFVWKFNGTATNVKTAQYVIEKARYKNTGTYTCEAYNSITGMTTVKTRKLSVKEEGALDEGLSDGAIAGIVIAVLIVVGAAIGLIIYCRQKVPTCHLLFGVQVKPAELQHQLLQDYSGQNERELVAAGSLEIKQNLDLYHREKAAERSRFT
ncbi:hypothetical protein PAMP_008534 [Pampus punctatissimus]